MAGIYRQRHPEHTVFYRVFFYYFERFLREYESRFEREYGYFRPVIQDVVEKYLDCGNPMCGFARIARVTSHIPDKGQVMIRYYGLYSNAHLSHPPIIEDGLSYVPSKGWAEMIRGTAASRSPTGTPDDSRGEGGVVDLGVLGMITFFRNVHGRKFYYMVISEEKHESDGIREIWTTGSSSTPRSGKTYPQGQ